jgi:hypothetical protein
MIGVVRPEARYALPTSRRKTSGSVDSFVEARGERPMPITRASGSAPWIES